MNNKLNFIITGATAAMLLLPMKTNAQSLNMGLRNSVQTSATQKVRKMNPADVRKMKEKTQHSYSKLFRVKAPRTNRPNGLWRMHDGGTVAPLALEPRVPLRSAKYAMPREMWGDVVYDNTWEQGKPQYGIYKFFAGSSMALEPLGMTKDIVPNGGGAIVGDKMYIVQYEVGSGFIFVEVRTFDTETWQEIGDPITTTDGVNMIASETAVAKDGTIYGCFYSEDAQSMELGIADYANRTRSTIGTLNNFYIALGITSDNVLYGVADDGNLYKIDAATAKETKIGSTGITVMNSDEQYSMQAGEIDQKDNKFYWASVDYRGTSKLYTVNLSTAALELVGEFTNDNTVTMLTLPEALAETAPAAATALATEFLNGSLSGKVSFKLPTKNVGGGNLSGSVSYSIAVGNTVLKSGSASAGTMVTENVTFDTDGIKRINVTTSNADGKGEVAKITKYVGFDTPKMADGLKFTMSDAGDVSLSWNAVTEGVNDGYIGNVKYDVVRYPDMKTVAKGITATSCTDKLTSGTLTAYSYGIKAYNEKMTGEEARTDYKIFGESIEPPYLEPFNTEAALQNFTIIDNNNDDSKWGFSKLGENQGVASYKYSADNNADDWLITPPIKVEKGKVYTIKFKARSYLPSYAERLEVKCGSDCSVAGMTTEVLPATTLPGDYQEFEKEITADKDGNLYIGFHAVSEKNMYLLYLDDISVSAGKRVTVPAAAGDFTVAPGAKGAKSATISFTTPSKTINGKNLTGNVTLKIKRGEEVIKEIKDVAPGSKQTYVDNDAANGLNEYSVTSFNADGEGNTTETVTVYVGVDKPDFPAMTSVDQTTSIKVSWVDKETGKNGGYVDTEHTAHKFYTVEQDYDGSLSAVFEADVPAGTNFYEKACVTNEGEQTLARFGVSAINDAGESAVGLAPAIIVGKPYNTPFFESAPDGTLGHSMWTTSEKDFSYLGLLRNVSSDDDNGCFAFESEEDDGYGILGTGKINLSGATNPMLIFSHRGNEGTNAKFAISVKKPDGTVDELKTIDVANDKGLWVREYVSLNPEYANLPYIILQFKGTGNKKEMFYMDEIYVRDVYEYDLSVNDVTAPAKVKKGETAKVDVTVTNFGSDNATDYTVKLYAGDKLIDSKEEKADLAPFASKKYTFDYTSSVMDQGEAIELKAEVEYETDLNLENNTKSVSLTFDVSNKPRPEVVNADYVGKNSVRVSWSAVAESAIMTEDGFEECESWAKDSFGGWTGVVGTSTPAEAVTGGIFEKISYPTQGENFAFTVVDPLNNWLTQGVLYNNPDLAPHAGDKYVASFYKGNPTTGNLCDADNWLISPSLSGRKQIVTFWVSNLTSENESFAETFDVLYSTGSTDINDFVKIGNTHTANSGSWEQVTVDIPEGAKRFAIHQTTSSAQNFMFMIDDVNFEAGSGTVTGYNVYRDGKLLKSVKGDELTFTDNTVEPEKTYVYAVSALFADGESEATLAPAITTDIESVEDILKASSYDVYTTDGKLIGKGMKTLKTLKNGSYIINDQKVIIR